MWWKKWQNVSQQAFKNIIEGEKNASGKMGSSEESGGGCLSIVRFAVIVFCLVYTVGLAHLAQVEDVRYGPGQDK